MPREWNAVAYDALPLPHVRWGKGTIARLRLTGDETVMDAGCGTGRDAQLLLDRLPRGRVIAVDGSTRMLDQLHRRLGADLSRVQVVLADLEQPLPVDEPVDAIMSVAAFHWIRDHDALFANLAAVLRPGGQLATECGGQGNIVVVVATVDQILGRPPSPWLFAGVQDTRSRLTAAGFTDLDVRLIPDLVRFEQPGQLREFLRTVVLSTELVELPADRHDDFLDEVIARLPRPAVDYVRLEITATRG
jgi:trans-aconitate 2-methyltransferase